MLNNITKESWLTMEDTEWSRNSIDTITLQTQNKVQGNIDSNLLTEIDKKKMLRNWFRVKYHTVENLLKIDRRKIRVIEHPTEWKLIDLVKISGWENEKKYEVRDCQGFRSWIRWLYDIPEENIWKNEIKSWLLTKYTSIESLSQMNATEIRKIEYPPYGKVVRLWTLSWWKNPKKIGLQIPEGFRSWIKWLFEWEE